MLTRAAADLVWTACSRAAPRRTEAEDAFREVMAVLRADGFARLKGYDGRAPFRVYLALVVRDLLSERVVKRLTTDPEHGWRVFEAFFSNDIRRMILRMLPGHDRQHNREDAYQAICEALLKDDFKRLRAYSGRGSPSGFILHIIENLLIDYVRTIMPRWRLPAFIQRLSELDKAVFRLLYWERLPADASALIPHLGKAKPPPTAAAVIEAIARVRAALPPGYRAEPLGTQTVDISAAEDAALAGGAEYLAVATPEDALVDGEEAQLLEDALAALQQVLPRLGPAERLYLQLALGGHPAREIARLLALPAERVHKLAQKVKKRLREEIGDQPAVKKWRLSV